MRIVLLLSSLAACTDNLEPLVEHSGARLKLMYASDTAHDSEGVLDTELPAECTFQRVARDSYLCLPSVLEGALTSPRFVHADCQWQVGETNIVPTFLVADDGLVVHHQFHDIAGGFDCELDATGTCQPTDN